MTLHDTTEFSKKFGVASVLGIVGIIVLVLFFKMGVFVKNIIFPPAIAPADQAYGKIPQLLFPESSVKGEFTYTIDTLDGTLPTEFPDRVNLYPMIVRLPDIQGLTTSKARVQALDFNDSQGNPLTEIALDGSRYEWDEPTGLQRKIIFNTTTQNFTLTSQYLTSLTALNGSNVGNQEEAFNAVQSFLHNVNSMTDDIDITLTQNPDTEMHYVSKPQMFAIENGELIPATSLSKTQVFKVSLYQKAIEYKIIAGREGQLTHFQNFDMKLPIVYPNPPNSTINFIVASGNNGPEVVMANYNHQTINLKPDKMTTYPILTTKEAYDALQKGNGYIAAYSGTDSQIFINKVYLAYYLDEKIDQYLMPVYVFEGKDGFFGYVSAIKPEAME